MKLPFVNRERELAELDSAGRAGGLLVVYGRRRIGKTRLLRHWLDGQGGSYSQAIEAQKELQVDQVFTDLREQLGDRLVPKTWSELLELLSSRKGRWVVCLDEFPYLTTADPSLPSRLQAWIDHSLPAGCLLVLAGSSTTMMHDLFLNRSAPLYGRARKLLHLEPMGYQAFCDACRLDPENPDSFDAFACVGGIPKYWEFVDPKLDVVRLVHSLYFDFAPYMEQEPQRILRDETISGLNALALLEAVGRGAERPSEIASRMGTAQTNLSRPLQQLIDASILVRDLPFGESLRSTKKVLLRIQDPTIRFWFRVFSPHRSLWPSYSQGQKRKLVRDHASTVFEDAWRAKYPGAKRYWESGLELDLVAPDPRAEGGLLVAEVKWQALTAAARKAELAQLADKWSRCTLRTRHPRVRFEVLDQGSLSELD